MVDKNLFLYDLAVVAILKNEEHYLKEWLDYHLLAGVEHFYLYDNDSTDNQAEVAKPYVEAGLVDYFPAPGKVMQMPVYNDAVKNFKFFCRYMAFIDLDEFIFPKTNQSISEIVDEILLRDKNAGGLAINWQMFGSNGHEKADYYRGVLERFTRRAPSDFGPNRHVKTISNSRKIYFIYNPHCARYFEKFYSANETGNIVTGFVPNAFNVPITAEKLVVNHYYVKSREEFIQKVQRGRCDQLQNTRNVNVFEKFDRNEVFDDGILKYRAARAENFSLESDTTRINRVIETLTETLSGYAAGKIFSMETALTCRALSTYLRKKYPNDGYWKICEEASLAAILKSMQNLTVADAQLLIRDLPNLLRLPYPVVEEIRKAVLEIIPQLIERVKLETNWRDFFELNYIQDLLKE